MSNAPTLINLPPPPSDPVTPSDVPSRSGTPNSATTSMSELSTVAIKDGHRGHLPHHHYNHLPSAHPLSGLHNQLDAERADRISRLAGLERVTTARNPPTPTGNLTPSAAALAPSASAATISALNPSSAASHNIPLSYFDSQGNPQIGRERSTVGSASATGSVGGRTTWAGSEAGDAESMDLDTSSVGGMSDEGTASLVGFGEGARTPARQSVVGGSSVGGKGATPTARDARSIDGLAAYEVDDAGEMQRRAGLGSGSGLTGAEQAERIVRENMDTTSADRMRGRERAGELGKLSFEK